MDEFTQHGKKRTHIDDTMAEQSHSKRVATEAALIQNSTPSLPTSSHTYPFSPVSDLLAPTLSSVINASYPSVDNYKRIIAVACRADEQVLLGQISVADGGRMIRETLSGPALGPSSRSWESGPYLTPGALPQTTPVLQTPSVVDRDRREVSPDFPSFVQAGEDEYEDEDENEEEEEEEEEEGAEQNTQLHDLATTTDVGYVVTQRSSNHYTSFNPYAASAATPAYSLPAPLLPLASKASFKLYSLPRELRDKVYEHLTIAERRLFPPDTAVDRRRLQPMYYVRNDLVAGLLALGRQFHAEYMDSVSRHRVLVIKARSARSPHMPLRIPKFVASAKNVEIWLVLNCDHGGSGSFPDECARPAKVLLRHFGWLTVLLAKVPAGSKVRIRVRLAVPNDAQYQSAETLDCEMHLKEVLPTFGMLRCVQSVSVDRRAAVTPRSLCAVSTTEHKAFEWSAARGLVEYVEAHPMVFDDILA